MNEKDMLNVLMQNDDFKKALKELLFNDKALADALGVAPSEPPMYVWCVEMVNKDGNKYYHPAVIPASREITFENMQDISFYKMMGSANQFEAYQYESYVNMFRMMFVHPIMLLSIPRSVYTKLEEALGNMVGAVIAEAEHCFAHIDKIARITHANADAMKAQFMMSIFANITVVASCIDQDMVVHDGEDHEYEVERRTFAEDDYDDEEEDTWICPRCGRENDPEDDFCPECGPDEKYEETDMFCEDEEDWLNDVSTGGHHCGGCGDNECCCGDGYHDEPGDEAFDEVVANMINRKCTEENKKACGCIDDCENCGKAGHWDDMNLPDGCVMQKNVKKDKYIVHYLVDGKVTISVAELTNKQYETIQSAKDYVLTMTNGDVIKSKDIVKIEKV